ncbi:protein MIX23-like [Zophobas morio]|uniref:protein MIX23-like n=1 Tax=Zophobas morio TaxID=2755281 RepID=UPI003082AF73
MTQSERISCKDYNVFKQSLKNLRRLDDLIVQKLNTTIPTDTFKNQCSIEKKRELCESFRIKLAEAHKFREWCIVDCIAEAEKEVNELRTQKLEDRDNDDVVEAYQSSLQKLRMLKSDLAAEQVVQERSIKVWSQRCSSTEVLHNSFG